ncbi:DENN/MADD domain containing 2Db [Silurus asotus]|uniref:DENN/MADD domain containing 2Db n=1 Tax=Silurus asotus TaxID=30991 RepID=A0AAD5A6C6_SILAS|nr:DENN/MADD domain containing 2Db [Silurus asotus]
MLIPSRLQEELLQDLCKRKHNASTEELNSVVSEAFLSFFVKTVGHFANHIKRSGGNKQLRTFQKKNFLKAVEPKENRNFVKQFVQTQMFDLFIQEEEKLPHHEGFFHRKIVEFQLRKKEKSKTGVIKGLVV